MTRDGAHYVQGDAMLLRKRPAAKRKKSPGPLALVASDGEPCLESAAVIEARPAAWLASESVL